MSDEKTMLDSSYAINYKPDTIDITDGKMVLNIEFSAAVYKSIDKNFLSLNLKNMTGSQINDKITDSFGDQVLKVKVNFWPFWVTKAPNNQKAIGVSLKFD